MPFGIVGRTGPGMRQVVGFGDRSTVMGTFGGEFGERYGPRGPTGRTCATAPRRGPLVKLLYCRKSYSEYSKLFRAFGFR